MILNLEQLPMELPSNRLFRFRTLNEDNLERELDAISKSYLYAPTFSDLNDPMEGFFGTIAFVTDNQSLAASFDRLPEIRESIMNVNKTVGIISFTTSCENLPMWAYYAGNFTGICLEFSVTDLCLGDLFACGPCRVQYLRNALEYHDMASSEAEWQFNQKYKNLLSKPYSWGHENEWRFLANPGKNYYPQHALKRIWVGPRSVYSYQIQELGRKYGIDVWTTVSRDYQLIPDDRYTAPFFHSRIINPNIKELIDKEKPINVDYFNNLIRMFDNIAARKGYEFLSVEASNSELQVKGAYTYANGNIKRFIEIYELNQLKQQYSQSKETVPLRIIFENSGQE
jgi:hypothetical protein